MPSKKPRLYVTLESKAFELIRRRADKASMPMSSIAALIINDWLLNPRESSRRVLEAQRAPKQRTVKKGARSQGNQSQSPQDSQERRGDTPVHLPLHGGQAHILGAADEQVSTPEGA